MGGVDDVMVQELVKHGNRAHHQVAVPLFQVAVGDDRVHHKGKSVQRTGKCSVNQLVAVFLVDFLIEDVGSQDLTSLADRTQNGGVVVPTVDGLTGERVVLALLDNHDFGHVVTEIVIADGVHCHFGVGLEDLRQKHVVEAVVVTDYLEHLRVLEPVVEPLVAGDFKLHLDFHTKMFAHVFVNLAHLVENLAVRGVRPNDSTGFQEVFGGDVSLVQRGADTMLVVPKHLTRGNGLCGHVGKGLVRLVEGGLQPLGDVGFDKFAVLELREQFLALVSLHGGFHIPLGDEIGNRARIVGHVTFFLRDGIAERPAHIHHAAAFDFRHFLNEGRSTLWACRNDGRRHRELLSPEAVVGVNEVGVLKDGRGNQLAFLAVP